MNNKGLNWIHGLIATVLAILFLLFGGYILIPLFGKSGGLFAGVFIAGIAVIFTLLTKTKFSEVLPHELPPMRKFFGAVLMYIGVNFTSSAISVFTSKIFDSQVRDAEIDSIILKMSPVTAILIVAVLPAICEEFFCRGFLVRCFNKIKNEYIVIGIVGVIFGAMHLDLYTFIPTAFMGAVLCYIAIRTKSLIIPIFLHFANNAFAVVLSFMTSSGTESSAAVEELTIIQSIGMAIFFMGIALAPIYIGYKLFNGSKLFVKKHFICIGIAFALFVTGNIIVGIGSMETVDEKGEIFDFSEKTEYVVTLKIEEEGTYFITFNVTTSESLDITLKNGDKNIRKETVDNRTSLSIDYEHKDGDVYFVIVPTDIEKASDIEGYYSCTVIKLKV